MHDGRTYIQHGGMKHGKLAKCWELKPHLFFLVTYSKWGQKRYTKEWTDKQNETTHTTDMWQLRYRLKWYSCQWMSSDARKRQERSAPWSWQRTCPCGHSDGNLCTCSTVKRSLPSALSTQFVVIHYGHPKMNTPHYYTHPFICHRFSIIHIWHKPSEDILCT